MGLRSDDAGRDAGPLHQTVSIEVAQQKTAFQQTAHTDVDLLFADVAAADG